MKRILSGIVFILSISVLHAQSQIDEFKEIYAKAMESGQIDEAISISQEWIKKNELNPEPYFRTAKAYLKKGRKDEAGRYLEQSLEMDSTYIPALIASADLAKAKGDNPILFYEKLIALNPTNALFYREGAEASMEFQDVQKGFAYYGMAYELDSLDLITLTGFAKLFLDLRQTADADTLITRALKIEPNNKALRLMKAKIAFDAKKWEEVVEWTLPLLESNPSITTLRFVGISKYHLREYQESIDVLRNLANRATELDYPHYYMALSMEKLGQNELAEVQYRQAINKALSPNLGAYYERLGLINQSSGNHEKAIENLRMALNFSARSEITFHLAKSYDIYYQDPSIALKTYQKFLQSADSSNIQEIKFAEARVSELKKDKHFKGYE